MDIESLKRELAYNQSVMQSCYNDPNKTGLYHAAQSKVYEIMKILEQFDRPNSQPIYANEYNQNYNQRPSFQGFQQSYAQSSYDNIQTGVNLNNSRYSNRPQPNTRVFKTDGTLVEEKPEIKVEVEKTPYPGNEYPFLTDKYTISNKISVDNIHYQYEISKVEGYDRSLALPPAKKIDIESTEITDNKLEDILLTINLKNEISFLDKITTIPISKAYSDISKLNVSDFKLADTPDSLPYDDYLVKPIDRLLTRLYNLRLGVNQISIDCDDIRSDMADLVRLAGSNQIKDLGVCHYDILEEIDNWIEKNLIINIDVMKSEENTHENTIDDFTSNISTRIKVPCIFIPTELALNVKRKHIKEKHLYVSKQSYKVLYNVMNELTDKNTLFGVMFYRSNTGGVGYFLFSKSNYNTYILSI